MKAKLKIYLWTLPRWFALPWFGGNMLLGAFLAGGISINAWLGFVAGMLLMAAGHTWNSYLDWDAGLDRGPLIERSAEKVYTGAQNLIEKNLCSPLEVALVALVYDILAFLIIGVLLVEMGWPVFLIAFVAAIIPWFYTWGKFNWLHETTLFIGVGPVAAMLGMFSVNSSPPIINGILASLPTAIILTYLGLSFDEWLDAKANLGKGVKSLAYMVWKLGLSLEWYISIWLCFLYLMQIYLITIEVLVPLTAITMLLFPAAMACLVLLNSNFRKFGAILVIVGAMYPILLLIGQVIGG